MLVSIMTLASFLKVQRYAFFGTVKETLKDIKEVPFAMCFSMVLLAVLCIGMGGILLPGVKEIFIDPAVNALLNGKEYISLVLSK